LNGFIAGIVVGAGFGMAIPCDFAPKGYPSLLLIAVLRWVVRLQVF
jgi:F0F1-type ATP synthase assembly protein I